MRRLARTFVLLTGAAMAMTMAACGQIGGEPAEPPESGRLSVAASLGGGDAAQIEGFERALEPRVLTFPADHGPHPDFKTEWWYFVGNLAAEDGRRFGYQITFFRSALAASQPAAASASDWATRQLYMAHLALTDLDAGSFHSFERFSRGAAGLAGAQADPLRVWVENWSVAGSEVPGEWRIQAKEAGVEIDLALAPGKPRVLHGDGGFSRKGAAPGAASYYYSRTRMPTGGSVSVAGESFAVTGTSWFDREWSTSLLAPDEVGWDWLAAQFDDGRELMIFRLRRRDGSSARVDGTLVERDGSSRGLLTEGVEIAPLATWTSLETGIAYPAGFRIVLPNENLSLEVAPLQDDQELRLSFVYWEGAVSISGSATGLGYLEMTGYGERASPR